MESAPVKKRSVIKIIFKIIAVIFILALAGGVYLYYNFNKLLQEALLKSFNTSLISDVYELKFEGLSVNFLTGNIQVHDVAFQPREKPLQNYPYINSELRLRTRTMNLKNVEIVTLLKTNRLQLDEIEITEPEVKFRIEDKVPVFFPFKDSVAVAGKEKKNKKRSIESYFLKEFSMVNASFEVTNLAKEREFKIHKINISLKDMFINQFAGEDKISYKSFTFSIGEFAGSLQKQAVKYISFKDFSLKIDSLDIVHTVDTAIYRCSDLHIGLKELDTHTADSLFHLTMGSFDLSYKDKSIKLHDVSYKPNVSDSKIQSLFKYRHTRLSATFGKLWINNIDFDSLMYRKKLFIDEVILDKASISLYKDNTKPSDLSRIPPYLGQQIKAITLPLRIKQVKVTNANLVNAERKPDGTLAKAEINRATIIINNVTNLSSNKPLSLNADAFIENKVHTKLNLAFSYAAPQFDMRGRIDRFALADLNKIIQAYTPAKILNGTADEITFSGTVYQTYSTGTMKFLYHDLEVDIAIQDKAKWKSDVISFAANTLPNGSNPPANLPPRIVQYNVERKMNAGFVNLMIRSILSGLKETMVMSKENRKAYKKEKKKFKKELKELKKKKKKEEKEAKEAKE